MSEVEQNIVSVERILHYVKLEPEAPAELPGIDPEDWPTQGEVEFKDYGTRYRPGLDLVLKDINIKIVSCTIIFARSSADPIMSEC